MTKSTSREVSIGVENSQRSMIRVSSDLSGFSRGTTGNPTASVIGAPVSGMILDHTHWIGVSSWRWLLILEGIPAVLAGILTYFFLPDRRDEAKFLIPEEKDWLSAVLRREKDEKQARHQITIGQVLAHGRVWHLIAIYFPLLR